MMGAAAIDLSEMYPTLTARQREVCALLIKGYSHKEISLELNFGRRTVEDHVQEILRRTKSYDTRRLIYQAPGSPEVVA